VTDHQKDHEIDFVVATEGGGIVCLEVEGRHIWHDGTGWFQQQRKGSRDEPVVQERSRERLYVGVVEGS